MCSTSLFTKTERREMPKRNQNLGEPIHYTPYLGFRFPHMLEIVTDSTVSRNYQFRKGLKWANCKDVPIAYKCSLKIKSQFLYLQTH